MLMGNYFAEAEQRALHMRFNLSYIGFEGSETAPPIVSRSNYLRT